MCDGSALVVKNSCRTCGRLKVRGLFDGKEMFLGCPCLGRRKRPILPIEESARKELESWTKEFRSIFPLGGK